MVDSSLTINAGSTVQKIILFSTVLTFLSKGGKDNLRVYGVDKKLI